MPELPEVETIVRDLAPRLVGQALKHPKVFRPERLKGTSRQRFLRILDGNRIQALTRRAKHAVFLLESGHRLVIQPGMTGSLLVADGQAEGSRWKQVVLAVGLEDGGQLLYRDVRRLGTIRLLDQRQWNSYTERIGPEPLSEEFGPEEFARRIGSTKQPVKKALMDQKRIAGVGNIYATEALFLAGIDPSRPGNRLDRAALERLYHAVRDVLARAIAQGGTTFRDYRRGTGEPGSFQLSLLAYGRGGQPCVRCGTLLATTHSIDGRATTFCWRCQGGPAALGSPPGA